MTHDHSHGHTHPHSHDHRHAPGGLDWGDLVAEFEIEAAALAPLLARTLDTVIGILDDPVASIADLGCGPGVAAVELAVRCPSARVVAADASASLLAEAMRRAERHGVADRLSTRVIDLERDLAGLHDVDLVWASMVLHHVADLPAVLSRIRGVVRPGGTLAVVEFGPASQQLPDDLPLGAPGLGLRWNAAMRTALVDHLPDGAFATDWRTELSAAGFEVVTSTVVALDVPAPLDAVTDRWLVSRLRRSLDRLGVSLDADDVAALTSLASDESAVLRRSIALHDDRWLHVARRVA